MKPFAGVIGAGKSGLAAARLLSQVGYRVLLSEKGSAPQNLPKSIDVESGGHSARLLECELLVRSPGVPNHLPILRQAAQRHIPLWSEIELASRYSKAGQIVAITGTNGKTTTTTLVGEFFKAARHPTFVGGNIGTPFAAFCRRTTPHSVVVLETSSYQLEDIVTFHPTISAILNITPDHLEHHGTMRAYSAAKARIFENQTAGDVCVLNADDAICRRLAKRCRAQVFWFSRRRALRAGLWYQNGILYMAWRGRRQAWPLVSRLPGPHNTENVLAAVAMGIAGGISLKVMDRVLRHFPGVEHRLEFVRQLEGVDYINDSKGTNVDSTRVALASFDRPIVLIAGGQGKGSPYIPLRTLVKKRVKMLVLIGEDAKTIKRELGDYAPVRQAKTMSRAVAVAHEVAEAGDVVLLSPACASFDQYRNYEHRGEDFKTLVRRLR